MKKNLTIGFAACFFHADPTRPIFKGKTLLYFEDSMAKWVMQEKAIPFLLPATDKNISVRDLVSRIDGLLLQAGSDVSPTSYGETPLKPEWLGDVIRDKYEMALVKECIKQDKPVLGICRGLQILNVAMKGSLYQDIKEMKPESLVHRNWDIYDQNFHQIKIVDDSPLAKLYKRRIETAKVNSIHHQGIKVLGKGLVVEATSPADGIIEAVRYLPHRGGIRKNPYVFAVQWHPEFHDRKDKSLLDSTPIIKDFINECKRRK